VSMRPNELQEVHQEVCIRGCDFMQSFSWREKLSFVDLGISMGAIFRAFCEDGRCAMSAPCVGWRFVCAPLVPSIELERPVRKALRVLY
jgi:hypothetical protein